MAETIIKLIPRLHTYRTARARADAAAEVLKKLMNAEEVSVRLSDRPEFVDCGAHLKEIRCPRCGAPVPRGWWREKMNEMYTADHFFVLEQEMPCCTKQVSFNDLRYDAPCGFSCLEFTVRGAQNAADAEVIDNLGERFGLLFRAVEKEE